ETPGAIAQRRGSCYLRQLGNCPEVSSVGNAGVTGKERPMVRVAVAAFVLASAGISMSSPAFAQWGWGPSPWDDQSYRRYPYPYQPPSYRQPPRGFPPGWGWDDDGLPPRPPLGPRVP